MNLRSLLPFCTAVLALFISTPAWANHVDRPASGHGVDNTCSINEPCQTFGTPFPASDGLSVTPYTYNDGTGFNYLDIFAVSGISAGTTVTFSFATLPADGQFGVFTCSNPGFGTVTDPGTAVDASGNVALSTSCTGILNSQSSADFVSNSTGPVTTWNFSGNGGVSTWWFYAVATGPTLAGESIYLPTSVNVSGGSNTVPEPGTLLLLASGIVGLALLRRRQAQA